LVSHFEDVKKDLSRDRSVVQEEEEEEEEENKREK
jgi:hypothetical protein